MISSTNAKVCRSSPVLSWFRKRLKTPVTCLLLGCFTLWSTPSQAADFIWDGGTNTWDDGTTPWWNGGSVWTNSFNNTAVFGAAPGTVTLGGAITAGGLTFNSNGYLVTGNTLTLGAGAGSLSPVIAVNGIDARATISSILAGTNGFTKTGVGTLLLTNNANSFSGDLSIKNGVLTITDVGQLGTGTTAISVTGVAQTGNPGYSGGTLMLAGSSTTFGTGLTLNREVSVSGRGTNAVNNTGGLISVGNNTLAGGLTFGSAAGENRIWATHGTTFVTGGVNLGVVGQSQVFQGNGNWIISGVVTGSENANDRFIKSGQIISSTLWLQNSGNTFTDSVRVDSGTVRVATVGAMGLNIGTQSIDLQNGSFEIRTDAPGDFISKSVIQRTNTSGNIFLDHDLSGPLGIGTSMQGQTVALAGFRTNVGNSQTATFAINSRNGYGASFTDPLGGVLAAGGGDGNTTININANGPVTFNGSLLGVSSGTNRVLTMGGNGDSQVTGSITPGGTGRHIFVKGGTGTLTLDGAAGTMLGSTNITGTLVVTGIGAFNSSGVGAIQLNSGALDYRGTGETSTKLVNLLGTTAHGIILANQSSGTGLVFNGNPIGAGGIGAKTLFLGGNSGSSIINEIGGVINNSTSATSLAKVGGGTWLYAPEPSTYAAAVSVNSGVVSGTGTNLLTVADSTGIMVGQAVTGTNVPAGSVVVSISGNDIRLSNNIGTTAVAAGTALTFRASSNFTGNVTVSGGTLKVRPTAGSGNGSDVINDASQLIFAADALSGNQWAGGTFEYQGSAAGGALTEQVGALTVAAGAGSVKLSANGGTPTLNFASLGTRTAGATLNLNPGAGTAITFTTAAGANGLLGGYATFGEAGTDFAANVVAAGSASALTGQLALPTSGATSTVNYQSTSTPGANLSAQSINSLKMSGSQTITLGGVLTITSGGLLFDNSTGPATIQHNGTATNTLGAAAETIITINGSTPANALTVDARIGSGAASLTKAGTGTLIIGGDNNYTGSTTVNAGVLQMAAGSITASLGVPAAGSVFTLRQNGTLDINGAGANAAPYTGGTALNTLTIGALNGSGVITSSSATASAISLGNAGTTVTTPVFSGIIQDGAGVVSVIKNGTSASVQALTGLNTYTGATIISGGSVLLANSLADGAVSTTLTTTVGSNTATVASVSGLKVGQTIAANGNLPAGTTITAINGLTLTLSSNATGTDVAGAAFGAAGSLGLSSNSAGNLVFNNGVLRYQGSNATVYQTTQTPSVTTDRLFTLAGNATIQSSGQYGNSVLAGGTANNAALIFSNTGDLVFSVPDIARTLTLGGTSTGDNEMRVHLIDNGTAALAVTKADAGLWILNPSTSNNYKGTTTVSGGILRVADKDAAVQGLSASSPLVLNGGVLETSGSFTRSLGAPVAGTGTTVQLPGGASGFSSATPGRLVVTLGGGDLTWGVTNFNPSSLVLGSATALGETEITNNIAIGSAVRTISTINNGTTGTMVTAGIISGIISGAGTGGNAIIKNGNGALMLGNHNTFTGSVRVDGGNLIVTSIGTGPSSSLGASGALIYNPGNADLNALLYVGPGETANRDLTLQASANYSANRVYRMESSGTGALVWNTGTFTHTTRGDTVARVLTLEFRGSNTDNNQMNLVLANSTNATFANVLHIAKNDGGVWILNPASANTFTGNINANGGLLGLTANGIGAAANLVFSNGGIFAHGGDLSTSVPVILANNTSAVFAGSNNITLNGNITKASGANDVVAFSNNLEGGAVLTLNGNFINAQTTAGTRLLNIRGFGSTVWNGVIQNNSGTSLTNLNIAIANDASFTVGGTSGNTYTGGTTLSQGTFHLNKTGGASQIGTGAFNINGGVVQAGLALTLPNAVNLGGDPATFSGTNSIQLDGLVTNSGGNRTLFNNLSGGATLTLAGNVSLSNDATGRTLTLRGPGDTLISGIVQNGGAAAGGLAYSASTGTLTLTAANTATGALTANRNTITINGTNGAWAGSVVVNPLGTVTLDNSTVNANRLADAGAFTGQGGTLNIIGNASGTSETTGALTLNSVQSYITMSGAGPNVLTFASVNFANTGSSLNLVGVPDLGTINQVKFTTAPTGNGLINGIMPRVFISGGSDFAEYNLSNGVQAFSGYVTNINTASATQTLELTASGNTTANRTVNAIKIDGAGLTIGGATLNRLTLSAAAIINTGGSNSLSIPQVNLGANVGYIQVSNGTTLTVDSALYGTGGIAKALPGTLQINTPNYISSTTNLLNGTTRLNVALNALFPNQIFNINDGATLDLFGNTQYVGQLSDPGTMPGAGGTITTSAGTGTFVTNMAASTLFSGDITGSVNFGRVNGNTLTINSAQPYGGRTTLMGGNTTLESDGTILNTSEIHLNGGALLLSNNTGLQTQNNNRIGDAIPIFMRDGTISYTGRVSTAATETLGVITSAQGANTITVTTGGGTITSADLTIASLARSDGTTVNFTGTNLGQQGNNARILLSAAPLTVSSGALGAWAIANSTDYAAYNTGNGIGIVGQGGYTGYDGTFGVGNLTEIPATSHSVTTLAAGTTTTGLLKVSGAFNNNIAFTNSGDILNLELGGILRSNNSNSTSFGTTSTRGIITSGTNELIIYNAATGTANFTGGSTTATSPVITMTSTVGLSPGMTITNAGLPTGTYIVSVDSATQVTVSQNATATAGAQTFVGGANNVIVNSVIQGTGVRLVKSGAGNLNLSANNTYTGGTSVIQGTVNLIGSGVVIPAGDIILGGATMTMLTNAGQIDPTNSVTLRRGSILNLAGSLGNNNTLDSLIFENNGGTTTPAVNIPTNSILTLTNSTPVSVTTSNAPFTPTIAGGTLALSTGANTFDVGPIQLDGTTYTSIQPSLNISSIIRGPASSINKTGTGILQLSGQSLYNGLSISAGGILISGNSTPTAGGTGLTSGPLGIGTVAAASGTTFLVDGSRSIANDITFAGTPNFDSTANTAWTLTLSGSLGGAGLGATPTIHVGNPFLTVSLLGNMGAMTNITKTGLGTLIFNSTNYTGDYNAAALGNGLAVSLLHDGTAPNVGNAVVQTIGLAGDVIFDATGTGTITVNRAGGSLPFNLAANKIISPASINTVLTNGLIVANTSGYGLQVADSGALIGTPTFTVNTATASNVTQGLYLAGALSGSGFVKAGAGSLVLANATNSFTGAININQGVVSVSEDAQLGNAANLVFLNPQSGTASFRVTDSFAMTRGIQLSNTSNLRAIEVVGCETLSLNSAFDLNSGAGATASLIKADNGTLLFNASNTGWSGALNITQGAVLVNNNALADPLGTGAISVSPGAAVIGAALQLAGGVNITNTLNMQGSNNVFLGGINSGGQLQSVSGNNTYSGTINFAFDGTIGADSGSTLNLAGPVVVTGTRRLGFMAAGDINIGTGATFANSMFGFDKFGSGTLTISVPISGAISGTGGFVIHNGMVVMNGTATANSSGAVNLIQGGATLRLDNSGTNTNNRLTGRAVTLEGGTFDFVSNNSTETVGALVLNSGGSVINMGGSGTAALTFASLPTQNGGSSLNVTGTFGTATNFLKFTTAPALIPATTGILPRVTTNGNEFATYNSTMGIVPFTAYAPATNVLSAGATQTFKATNLTANSLTGNQTLNALTLSGASGTTNVGGLSGLNPTTLTLTSGGILVNSTGAATMLSVPVVTFGATGTTEAVIHVASGATLDVTSGLVTTGGMNKSLAGILNFNAQQYISGNSVINGGTLNLTPGGTNTLLFNNGLGVNVGGTVNLQGGVQFVAGLFSQGATGSSGVGGGTITNTGAQATLVVNSNNSFGGVIESNIFLNKTGTGALNFQAPQTYTGPTLLTGGSITLNDFGALPNTNQPIGINFATLSLANGNLTAIANRVNDTAPITLHGGVLSIAGRQQYASSETVGSITLAGGHNAFTTNSGGTNVNSLEVTAAALIRTGDAATVRFNATGQLGSSARLKFTSAPTLTNNIIGPWAIVDREYASYDSTYGIGALNGVGFAGYAGSGLNASPLTTDNVRLTAAGTTILAANTTVGTLTFGQQTTATILNLGGNTLTLQSGGLLIGQGTDNINFAITNGNLTGPSGGGDLYITHANFSGTNRTATIDAAITDNGGPIRVIKTSGDTGVSVMTWNGTNTYTGGTVLNMGTLVLGSTSTLGSGGLTVNQAILNQTAGSIIPAQALTLGGGASITLANQANSFTGITFNNLGGAAPTLNPTGTLTLTGGILVNTINAGGIATIGAGTLDLNGGAGTYGINVGAVMINGKDVAPWQAGLTINAVVQNAPAGGIVKSGAGMLLLAGQSTFDGGISVTAGGLIIGANSTPNNLNDTVITGPLGTGAVTMAAGTTLVAGVANAQVANDFTFLGDAVFNGVNSLTLNGITTLPSIWNATVTAPQMTVSIGDASPSLTSDVINKSGLGILNVGSYAGTIQATGGLVFTADGDTLGTAELLPLGGGLVITGDTAITVNRSGGAPNARNKTLQKTTLSVPGNIMSVSNLSGYGLEFTGATTMTGPSHFAVGVATASNVVQGLILSGPVSDGGSNFSLTKSGPGTLVLADATNSFGGVGSTIDILNGVVSVNSNGALGNISNSVTLNVDGSTGVGFRSTGTFTTARTFILNQANNAFEVTQGNTLTLTTPFSLGAVSNALAKNDNGIFAINADNTGWTGSIIINAGGLLVQDDDALGSGTITINNAVGSALLLTGGVTIANPATIGASASQGGLNAVGQIASVSGTNTYSGLITQPTGNAGSYGADDGATLNITGGIAASNSAGFYAGAGGVVNLASAYGTGAAGPTFVKFGPGILNVTANQGVITSAITINAGVLNVVGSGVGLGITGLITVNSGGTLSVDDSSGAPSAHLGGRPLTLVGGSFTYSGNAAANSAETFGALTVSRPGATITTNAGGAFNSTLTFASLALGGDSAANFVGTNLGTATNRILFTTAPTLLPASTGILARATVNGSNFATYGANGVAAFSAYQNSNNPNTAAATDTMNLTANAALTASRTLNAIKLNGTGLTLGGAARNSLTITSGGVLSTGGANTISVPVLQLAAVQGIFHVDAASSLEITSVLAGTAGWVKAGPGTLTLSPPSSSIMGRSANTITGNGTILDGTVILNGGNNTLVANQFLILGPTGTLDLNGNAQYVRGLLTDAVVENAGGTITGGTNAASTLIMHQDNTGRAWAGKLTGALSFLRTGENTLSIYSNNDYTGKTLLGGGTTTLRDGGRLSGTSEIEIVYATLNLDNTGTKDLGDRLNNAQISLRGGTLALLGRAQTASTENVGAVTLTKSNSFINSTAGGTGVNSADLILTSLNRAVGGGTVNFTAATGGLIGSSARILTPLINGVSTATAGGGLTNNIVGGWAIMGTSDFASYVPGLGFGALNQVGFPQYTNVTSTSTTLNSAGPNDNININNVVAGGIPVSDDLTINSLRMGNVAANTVNIAAGKTLTLASGGLLFFSTATQTIGAAVNQGNLTTSGPELFIYTQGTGPQVINSVITGAINVVKSGANPLTLAGANTYTGGTTVNQGTLTVAATSMIPLASDPANGLVINGATVTLNAAGLIALGNIVTLNGPSSLNLTGNNILSGLVFRDDGGGITASAVNSNSGTLTIEGNVVSTTANPASTSTLAGRVDFGTTQRTLDISATRFNSQEIAALLSDFNLQGVTGSSGGIIKIGDGVLQFNGIANYTGMTTVNEGRIQIGATNGGSRFSTYNLNGVNTGLNLNGLSTILGSLEGTGYVTNSSTTAGTLTVGYNGASTTFDGTFLRFNDATLAPVNLTKIGAGMLTLTSNASTSGGTLTINRGTVVYKDAGTRSFTTAATVVNEGGTLTLDNTGTVNINNRLNSTIGVTLNGGTLNLLGRASTATTESVAGVLTFGPSASVINLTAGAGGSAFMTFTSLAFGAGSTGIVTGTNLGTDTRLLFTTAPTLTPATTGILARLAVGTDFATYSTTNGVIAFSGYTTPADINTAAATATIKVDATTTVRDLTLARTINALNIIDNNVNIGASSALLPTQGLTVTSGGVLVNGNTASLSAPVIAFGGAEGIFRVNGSSLNVSGSITGTAGLTKTGTGSMTLSSLQSYTGQTALNLGNLTLAGGNNTLLVAPTGTIPTVADLQINGGVLDLNGNNQAVRTLLNSNTLSFIAGEITNSSGTTVTLTTAMNASSTFSAQITGNLNLIRSGNNTLTLPDAHTYTGSTIIRGGGLTLQDSGSLATSSITLNFGALTLNNANLNPLAALNPVRFDPGTPVTMQGGTIAFTPAGSVDNTTVINTVNILAGGANTITPNGAVGGTNKITIGNLVMAANSGTTLHFNTDPGQPTSSGAQVFLLQRNGVAPVNNSFLGSNVILNNGEYGAYVTTQGVGRYGATGFPAYAAALASGNNLPNNISSTGADVAIAANTTIGALRLTGAATRAITFTGGALVLNLAQGGLLRDNNNNATNIGTTALRGVLTSGGTATTGTTDLVVWHNQNTMTIHSVIANNGLGNLTRLVKSGPAGLTLTAANTYTGGTIVNQGTLTINATAGAGTVVIPGDVTLNNANLTMSTNAGQIAATSNVSINGSGVLSLVGSNTLSSLTFNNTGGNAPPSVAVGTALTLSSATPITVVNDNYSFTPTISGTLLTLQSGATISTSGLSPDNLIISAPISTVAATSPLVKTGSGSVVLSSAASAFANGFNLDQGSLIFGNNSAGTPPAVTAGPIGTGTLALANGVSIMSDGTARTIGNAVSVAGDFTFGTSGSASSRAIAGNSLTLSGEVTLAAGAHTIEVGGLFMVGTISGRLTGGTDLTKTGAGTLVLSRNTNDYGGATIVNAGTLQLGAAGVIPDDSALTLASGAALNINAFSETIGSLSGAGLVTNQGAAATLTTGGAGAGTTTFSGLITNGTNALNLVKIGVGTQILSGANTYTGTTTLSGGILNVGAAETADVSGPLGKPATAANSIVFNGGTLQYSAVNQFDYSSRFSSAAIQAVSIDTNAQTVTFATALTSSGGTLAKAGAGTLILTAASSYSGTTTVNGGILQVGTAATAGTAGLGGAGDVLVNAGSTLAGTGNAINNTITGSVILGGTGTSLAVMAPGDTTGTLAEQNARMNLGGSLTINASGQLQFQLTTATYQDLDYLGGSADALAYLTANPTKLSDWNTATPGDHDFINVAGGLTINANRADTAFGMGTVQLFLNSYTSPAAGDVFNLIDWVGALAGSATFNTGTGFSSGGAHGDFDLPTLTGGLAWDTSAFASYGVVVVVPEPGRALFLLMGLLALAFRRRR